MTIKHSEKKTFSGNCLILLLFFLICEGESEFKNEAQESKEIWTWKNKHLKINEKGTFVKISKALNELLSIHFFKKRLKDSYLVDYYNKVEM